MFKYFPILFLSAICSYNATNEIVYCTKCENTFTLINEG